MTTSRPVRTPPSTCTDMRERNLFITKRLVGFRKADLPGRSRVLDRGQRRCPRAALEARDGHMVGARLRHAGRDRADADLGDELDRDVRRRIDVLQSKMSCARSSMQ